MTPGEIMNFGRLSNDGSAVPHFEPILDQQAMMDVDITMFPFWRKIHSRDPVHKYGEYVKSVAVYLHLVRGLLPDFRGRSASKENFEAACKACATDYKPGEF